MQGGALAGMIVCGIASICAFGKVIFYIVGRRHADRASIYGKGRAMRQVAVVRQGSSVTQQKNYRDVTVSMILLNQRPIVK